MSGAILGTSAVTNIVANFLGPAHFDFASPIALLAGSLYVIEVTTPSNIVSIGYTVATNDYSGGTMIEFGSPVSGLDFWFRKGFTENTPVVPEPASIALLAIGAAMLARRRRNR